jgi:hypothetical protein
MLKRFNKSAVIAKKRGFFNIMYSLGFLIVELETARRRLLYVFGAPDGTPTSGLGIQRVAEGALWQNWLLTRRFPTRLAFAARIDRAPRNGAIVRSGD